MWNEAGEFMKKLLVAACLAVGLAVPNLAQAAVVYTLTGSGDFQGFLDNPSGPVVESFSLTYTSPTFITSDLLNVSIPGCSITGGQFGCTGASFNIYPTFPPGVPGIPAGGDIVSLEFTTPTGSGGAALVFDLGAFGAVGVYPAIPVIEFTPGQFAGSFTLDATLTVSAASAVPLPAALPLFASGLGVLGLFARRRRKAA